MLHRGMFGRRGQREGTGAQAGSAGGSGARGVETEWCALVTAKASMD